MRVKNSLISLCKKTLYESITADMMMRFMTMMDPDYDFYVRSGIPQNIPVTNQMAAERIVEDAVTDGRFIDFIEVLYRVDSAGYMGRSYPIKGLAQIVKAISQEGFIFDSVNGQFFEKSSERASPDWGRLHDGDERQTALLRLDIVSNSLIVKNNPALLVEEAYASLRSIVQRAVISRFGRLWLWEGDGALAAFVFHHKEAAALLSGMEILNELFFYNRLANPLQEPLKLRIAVHAGPVKYRKDTIELLKNDSIKDVIQMEGKATAINSLSASSNIFLSIDRVIQERFSPEKQTSYGKLRYYSVELGKQ